MDTIVPHCMVCLFHCTYLYVYNFHLVIHILIVKQTTCTENHMDLQASMRTQSPSNFASKDQLPVTCSNGKQFPTQILLHSVATFIESVLHT